MKTDGLYADDVGMPSEKYDAWRDYWKSYFGHHWKAAMMSWLMIRHDYTRRHLVGDWLS